MMRWLLIWFSLLTLCLVCSGQLTLTPTGPVFIDENLADILLFNGTYIWQDAACTIQAVEGQSSVPDIKIRIDDVITQGTCTFNVTLLSPIDFEKISTLNINMVLRQSCSGIETQQRINKLVVVNNLLDSSPVFTNSTYTVRIPENHMVNAPVVVNIQAIDPDGQDSVSYTVNFVDQQKSMFQVHPQINPEILDIFLISPLDFEQQHMHHFTITATDSVGMNSTCDVIIKVINIQDTPPAFTALQYNGRINEQAKIGSTVLTISATDGDSVLTQDQWEGTRANQIYYSILSGDAGMFGINSSTGEIITVQELDIDSNPNVTNGLVVLTVMAEELNTSLEPQYGVSTATVPILVQIEDANDNRPQFNSQAYTGNIRADAVLGELITIESGGYISVSDKDQAPSNNRFSLHIEKDGQPWDVFKPNIETQYAYASVMIQLNKNNSLIDFGDTHVKFQIVAQESGDLKQNFSGTKSDMTVWIKARTIPTAPPEPIIDLPLSASDIIVFIVGLLLLLNIGLTVFVCYALRGGRGYPRSPLNRNSKYYVSNKNKTDNDNTDNINKTLHIEELGNSDVRKGQDHTTRSDTPAKREQISAQVNRGNENGVVIADTEQERNIETQKHLSTNVRDSQMKSQATLMTILNENLSLKHNVTQHNALTSKDDCKSEISDSASTQQNQLDNESSNLGQGMSNFLQKVQQRLGHGSKYCIDEKDDTLDIQTLHEKSLSLQSGHTESTQINSNSSSFSERTTGDGEPLIKSSKVKFQSNVETAKELGNENEENKNFVNLSGTKLDKSVSWGRETNEDDKSVLSQTKYKKKTQRASSPLKFNSNTYPTASQITQTGVPPVALALPFSTGTLNINKESHLDVINPVYEIFATMDNEQTEYLTLEHPTQSLANTSTAYDKKNVTPLQPSFSMPVAKQNMAFQTISAGINYPPNDVDIMDKKLTSSKPSHENSSSYADGNSHEPSILSAQNSDKEKIKHHHRPLTPAENTQNSPSMLIKLDDQDFVMAAKNLLTTAKQDKRPEIIPQPKTVTITEDAKQVKEQNMTGDKFTSF